MKKIKIQLGNVVFGQTVDYNTFYIYIGWTQAWEVYPRGAKRYILLIGKYLYQGKGASGKFSFITKESKIHYSIFTKIKELLISKGY